jgi:hypothetical protein
VGDTEVVYALEHGDRRQAIVGAALLFEPLAKRLMKSA